MWFKTNKQLRKTIVEKEEKYQRLFADYKKMEKDYWANEDAYRRDYDALKTKYTQTVAQKDKEIERLKMDLDILRAHCGLDKEPTDEERSKIRINWRVHELELENLEMRAQLRNELNARLASMTLAIMNPQCQPYQRIPYFPQVERVIM